MAIRDWFRRLALNFRGIFLGTSLPEAIRNDEGFKRVNEELNALKTEESVLFRSKSLLKDELKRVQDESKRFQGMLEKCFNLSSIIHDIYMESSDHLDKYLSFLRKKKLSEEKFVIPVEKMKKARKELNNLFEDLKLIERLQKIAKKDILKAIELNKVINANDPKTVKYHYDTRSRQFEEDELLQEMLTKNEIKMEELLDKSMKMFEESIGEIMRLDFKEPPKSLSEDMERWIKKKDALYNSIDIIQEILKEEISNLHKEENKLWDGIELCGRQLYDISERRRILIYQLDDIQSRYVSKSRYAPQKGNK